jgi:hypothetical protein
MMVGAYAGLAESFITLHNTANCTTGNRLGAIRDAKGKAVAAVFAELGGTQKAEVSTKALLLSLIPM